MRLNKIILVWLTLHLADKSAPTVSLRSYIIQVACYLELMRGGPFLHRLQR